MRLQELSIDFAYEYIDIRNASARRALMTLLKQVRRFGIQVLPEDRADATFLAIIHGCRSLRWLNI
jgi:hypothetical protein